MADEEAQLLNKQAAAPAKASSSWRLAVFVAVVLGLVSGYVAGDAAVVNGKNPLEFVPIAGAVVGSSSSAIATTTAAAQILAPFAWKSSHGTMASEDASTAETLQPVERNELHQSTEWGDTGVGF